MSDTSFVVTPRYYVFVSDEGEENSSPSEDSSTTNTETEVPSGNELLEQVTLTNHLLVGIILFIGIFFGAFCTAHLFNRINKN